MISGTNPHRASLSIMPPLGIKSTTWILYAAPACSWGINHRALADIVAKWPLVRVRIYYIPFPFLNVIRVSLMNATRAQSESTQRGTARFPSLREVFSEQLVALAVTVSSVRERPERVRPGPEIFFHPFRGAGMEQIKLRKRSSESMSVSDSSLSSPMKIEGS